MEAGKLIDIPAEHDAPFKANPKPNQAGEMLTIIVTSKPLLVASLERSSAGFDHAVSGVGKNVEWNDRAV